MKLEIQDFCLRCGLCVDLYPDLFTLNYKDDVLQVKYADIPADKEQRAKDAVRDCTIAAIHIK